MKESRENREKVSEISKGWDEMKDRMRRCIREVIQEERKEAGGSEREEIERWDLGWWKRMDRGAGKIRTWKRGGKGQRGTMRWTRRSPPHPSRRLSR